MSDGAEKVGFGDDRDERDAQVGTEGDRVWYADLRFVEDGKAVEWRGGSESGMHQKAVVGLGERIDGVDIGREKHRGLRLAHRDYAFRDEFAHNAAMAGIPDESADL